VIEPERIQPLNDRPVNEAGRYVLYWMQASQREACNPALEHACALSRRFRKPLLVYFGLFACYPGANHRHFAFLLEGLRETRTALARRDLRLVVLACSPEAGAIALGRRAAAVVTDRGYLRHQTEWRAVAAAALPCPLVQVEGDAVVPVDIVSVKEEYAAAMIRKKIMSRCDRFMIPLKRVTAFAAWIGPVRGEIDITAPGLLARLKAPGGVTPSAAFHGGYAEARRRLTDFVRHRLPEYGFGSNDPTADLCSGLSPYLHFGQIAPVELAAAVIKAGGHGAAAFVEQLIVRRELALNFARYNPHYDSPACLPGWAARTLAAHAGDRRPYRYSLEELESARTHDPYWNAAQRQVTRSGHMHNYMRMYWGKKVIEWTGSVRDAWEILVFLNDKYELDGRDPNGYAGIAWCFGKHDRPWAERPVFGTVRYMNARGLERKFDIIRYADAWPADADERPAAGAAVTRRRPPRSGTRRPRVR
jgi:deoxyribodipyrimidine photo-lyase